MLGVACLIFCFSFFLPPNSLAQEANLGRLFYTDSQRELLDRVRLMPENIFEAEAATPAFQFEAELEEEGLTIEVQAQTQYYMVGGVMHQDSEDYSVWLNGEVYDQASLPEEIKAVRVDGVLIENIEVGTTYMVRTGQTLNLASGEIIESFNMPPALLASLSGNNIVIDALNEIEAEVDEANTTSDNPTIQDEVGASDDLPQPATSELTESVSETLELLNTIETLTDGLQ